MKLYLACLIACAAGGCSDERRYLGGEAGVYQVALTQKTPAAYAVGDTAIYIIEQRILLPLLVPSHTQIGDLTKGVARYSKLPFPRLPWVERNDLPIQIDFTLSNLDDAAHQVTVTVNGIDEFFEYEPGVSIVGEDAVPDYAQWERLYDLKPRERLTRTIREEELDEVAVDLATVVNGAPNSNQIVFFENKSATDPRAKPYIPQVIPGLAGIRVGMRATERGRLLLEASVRVRDDGGKLADQGAKHTFQFDPQPFKPVAPADDQ